MMLEYLDFHVGKNEVRHRPYALHKKLTQKDPRPNCETQTYKTA